MNYMFSQLNTGYLDADKINAVNAINRDDIIFSVVALVIVGSVLVVGYHAIAGFIDWVFGNKKD